MEESMNRKRQRGVKNEIPLEKSGRGLGSTRGLQRGDCQEEPAQLVDRFLDIQLLAAIDELWLMSIPPETLSDMLGAPNGVRHE